MTNERKYDIEIDTRQREDRRRLFMAETMEKAILNGNMTEDEERVRISRKSRFFTLSTFPPDRTERRLPRNEMPKGGEEENETRRFSFWI